MDKEEICQFIDEACPNDSLHTLTKVAKFMEVMCIYLPPEIHRLAMLVIPHPSGSPDYPLGIVIATNQSKEDMQLYNDWALIEELQDILGVQTEPAWYRITEP